MPSFGFLIDNRKCIGCHACTVACKSEHEVPIGVDRTWVKYVEKGTFPHNRRLFTVMRCNHCDRAPCVTICPVTALYRREDGVVDFNSDRCIGCKACMQACPYDALYIDPETDTAAKCNFCTHRLEMGLEPSCVVVCPEQAIVCGDLDEPESEISQLVERHPVQVRKPEKGTRPKLYYIEGDEAALVPGRTESEEAGLWSRTGSAAADEPASRDEPDTDGGPHAGQTASSPAAKAPPSPRRVYDVRPRAPAWGWPVVAYTWTKSVAAGALLAVIGAGWLAGSEVADRLAGPMGAVALVFLLLTAGLLVADLKQPSRFLYVMLRPQWGSWLVRGAYILTAYGALLAVWTVAAWTAPGGVLARILLWPGALLAVLSAVYTAFLFAQAKGRDLWQNPLLSLHLLAHALVAGGAVWLLAGLLMGSAVIDPARTFASGALVFSLVAMLGELFTAPATEDARRALDMIVGRPGGRWFWGAGIVAGHLLPLLLLRISAPWSALLAAALALAGVLVIERLWVFAPQRIPLS